MVEQLDLSDQDVTFIAEFIDYLIIRLVPTWKPSADISSVGAKCSFIDGPENSSMTHPWESMPVNFLPKAVVEKNPPLKPNRNSHADRSSYFDGYSFKRVHSQESIFSMLSAEYSARLDLVTNSNKSIDCVGYGIEGSYKSSNGSGPEINFAVVDYGGCKTKTVGDDASVGVEMNEYAKNTEVSFSDLGLNSSVSSLPSIASSLSLVDKDQDSELKFEIEAIESHYQQWFHELTKMRLEALEGARKRWITKKQLIAH
ncbi:PREDICTED: probable serine/threonine-protein kinase WNK4 [Nelumbo nucifera]|uniref:Probable serine/threonine-protein kinase WNK4 n=1 Tax=Nelumbo nucifera TaxID=4432 RepID=A0A1U8Q2Q9_NELNU|nr:PREDICTED: probable serine/threonine-protein kinase WNK4 [Nelumbo nucifera]